MTLTKEQRAAIEERRIKGSREIRSICQQEKGFSMSIPARPDYDSDLIFAACMTDIETLLQALREAEEQRDQALAQIVAAYAGLAECCSCDDTEEICPCCEVRKLISKTPQAHAERLRAEGALTAYQNALDAIENNTEPVALHNIKCAIAGLTGKPMPKQPTDAAEGGVECSGQ